MIRVSQNISKIKITIVFCKMHKKISAIILHNVFLQIYGNLISILFTLMTTAEASVQKRSFILNVVCSFMISSFKTYTMHLYECCVKALGIFSETTFFSLIDNSTSKHIIIATIQNASWFRFFCKTKPLTWQFLPIMNPCCCSWDECCWLMVTNTCMIRFNQYLKKNSKKVFPLQRLVCPHTMRQNTQIFQKSRLFGEKFEFWKLKYLGATFLS